MTTTSYKVPPGWPDDKTFDQWENEDKMWRCVTDLDAKQQAVAIALTLSGRKREVASEISLSELNADNGLNKLLAKLKEVFDVHCVDKAFEDYI